MISNSKKFIFLHIPKCAGTSINKTLSKYCKIKPLKKSGKLGYSKHSNIIDIHKTLGDAKFKDYYKFTFVRNPYDRILSLYFWGLNVKAGVGVQKDWHKEKDFNSWLSGSFIKNSYFKIWGNQIDLMYINNKVSIDYIGRFETLNSDWNNISKKLKITDELEHVYASNHRPYQEYYTDESIDIIRKYYKKDIEAFNYEFKR